MTETVRATDTLLDPDRLEGHRRELTGYCYRMLGSATEAEDVVQDVMLQAWRALDGFEGRSSLRTWLFRIAHNRCVDVLRARPRRARAMDIGPAASATTVPDAARDAEEWLEPVPDARILDVDADPAAVVAARDTIRLAFVAALQHLPPKQRAVLVLREAFAWSAQEVAELLATTVPAVNSALQRARATLADRELALGDVHDPEDRDQRALLRRYVDAFEAYDLDALAGVFHDDASQSMPPLELWLDGVDEIRAWLAGPGAGCRGSRLIPTVANGHPAFGQYRPSTDGDGYVAWALHVLEISKGRIAHFTAFLDTDTLFPLFGLPWQLEAGLEHPG